MTELLQVSRMWILGQWLQKTCCWHGVFRVMTECYSLVYENPVLQKHAANISKVWKQYESQYENIVFLSNASTHVPDCI